MKSILNVFRRGLQRTKTNLVRRVRSVFSEGAAWDEEAFEDLEAALLGADLGIEIASGLVDDIRDRYRRGLVKTSDDILEIARRDVISALSDGPPADPVLAPEGPTVVLLVGVNGSGKTTTAAKLAHMWQEDGRTVMLAACDTFRAAAIEQLQIWGERLGVPVAASSHGSDAAALAFDAVGTARGKGIDVLLVDTAGRQHTRKGLMDELEKLRRSVAKALPGAPHHVWLTVDGSTGTNALMQAREFGRAAKITGLILTKLDGSGKGGVVVPIRRELGYPVMFVGLGEGLDDMQPFDPAMFAEALFE